MVVNRVFNGGFNHYHRLFLLRLARPDWRVHPFQIRLDPSQCHGRNPSLYTAVVKFWNRPSNLYICCQYGLNSWSTIPAPSPTELEREISLFEKRTTVITGHSNSPLMLSCVIRQIAASCNSLSPIFELFLRLRVAKRTSITACLYTFFCCSNVSLEVVLLGCRRTCVWNAGLFELDSRIS